MRKGLLYLFFLGFTLMVVFSVGCRKNQNEVIALPEPTDSTEKINRWILDSMIRYYVWSDSYSSYPSLDKSPEVFFKELLKNNDKYSWITNGNSVTPEKSTYESFGFQYVFISVPAFSNQYVLGLITLVAPGSPAYNAGLRRGQYFSKVNGSSVLPQQVETIANSIQFSSVLKFTMVSYQSGAWNETGTKTMNPYYFEERPVFSRKVFRKNNKTIGYLFYNQFTETFDKDFLDAIDSFKTRNVNELILDLRYNPGGSVASAAKMATVLLNQITRDQHFAFYRGNSKMGLQKQSFEKAVLSSGNFYKRSFDQLHASALSLQRVYIITGKYTASAAEMMINNLKPYIEVIQVGEKTEGKDKAGVLLRDKRQPAQVFWQLYPMVFHIQNANQQGDYETGISPQVPATEYSSLPLFDLGNPGETLLAETLTLILGSANVTVESFRMPHQKIPLNAASVLYQSVADRSAKGVEIIFKD